METKATITTVAVLLTVHNRRETTLRCLRAFSACERPEGMRFDLFLTDDGSTDGTAEAVRAEFPAVEIISGDGNLYWCRGMVAAWEAAAAREDYGAYLWLNDDTFLYPDALTHLFASADRHPDAVIVGPVRSAVTGEFSYGGRARQHPMPPEGEEKQVPLFDGNIVLVPASVYHRFGMLDRRFSHAMGDTEYGARIFHKGGRIWQTAEYLGTCERHERMDDWCNPEVPLRKRWKALHSPRGCNPREFFLYDRHNGIPVAMFHYCGIYLRTLFPSWWLPRVTRKENTH